MGHCDEACRYTVGRVIVRYLQSQYSEHQIERARLQRFHY